MMEPKAGTDVDAESIRTCKGDGQIINLQLVPTSIVVSND